MVSRISDVQNTLAKKMSDAHRLDSAVGQLIECVFSIKCGKEISSIIHANQHISFCLGMSISVSRLTLDIILVSKKTLSWTHF